MPKVLGNIACVMTALVFAAHVGEADEGGKWKRSLAVGFNMTDGNSDTVTLGVGADAAKKWDLRELLLGAKFAYGETDHETTQKDFKADTQYNHLFTERAYSYLNASFLYDDISQVDYRVLVGPGLGYYLMKDDATSLAIEAGVAYLTEEVGDVTSDAFVFRFAERYERALSETAKIWQSIEYLPESGAFEAYLLNNKVGVEAAINHSLSLRMVFEDRYDSQPAPGSEKNDIILNSALVYSR